jgi:hypothetical protein
MYGIYRQVAAEILCDVTQVWFVGKGEAGAKGTGYGPKPKRIGECAQSAVYAQRVALASNHVNGPEVKIWVIVT